MRLVGLSGCLGIISFQYLVLDQVRGVRDIVYV